MRENEVYTASNRAIYSWGFGQVGLQCVYFSFAQLMQIYTTPTGFALSPVLVSWVIVLVRAVDSFADPLFANWSDNFHSRWGRRKPFLLAGGICGAFFVMAVWWTNPGWSEPIKFAYLLFTAVMLCGAWGLYALAHGAMGYELTDDYHGRSRLMAIKGLFTGITAIALQWVHWLTMRPFFGGKVSGIRWVSIGLAAMVLLSTFAVLRFTSERFATINRNRIKLLPAIRITLRNRPFLLLLLMMLTQRLGTALFYGLLFYVNVYYVCQGNESLASKIAGITGTTSALLGLTVLPFIQRISRRIGKRHGVMLGAGALAASALLVPFCLTPQMPYLQIVLWAVLGPLTTVGQTLTEAIFPDICDIDELENGLRREGMFVAVSSFLVKFEAAFCILLVGYLIKFAGFQPGQLMQSPETVLHLRWIAFTPYITCSLLALLFAWRFPITESMMAEVRRKLDARHAAKQGDA
jgi:GPH family glycoside/pentoside/hexuronide:cation symporter